MDSGECGTCIFSICLQSSAEALNSVALFVVSGHVRLLSPWVFLAMLYEVVCTSRECTAASQGEAPGKIQLSLQEAVVAKSKMREGSSWCHFVSRSCLIQPVFVMMLLFKFIKSSSLWGVVLLS